MTLFYVVALLAAFYMLLIAEFFLPSGGMLGVGAVAILAAAIGIAFSHSTFAGTSTILFVLVTTPMVMMGMLKVWPHTPIGRRMLNRRPGEPARDPPTRMTAQGVPLERLVGQRGIAKSNMLPSGMVLIDGEKIDAVSTGMPIDAGTPILVTSIDAGRVRVRAIGLDEPQPAPPQSPPSLEESLDAFDVDE
jgi:membrane-bound ClpP family serine protease